MEGNQYRKFYKRALRRHHWKRLLNKRKYYYWGILMENGYNKKVPKVINTPKSCSCWMCGNPRKHHKEKTRQELIWELKAKDQLSVMESIQNEI